MQDPNIQNNQIKTTPPHPLPLTPHPHPSHTHTHVCEYLPQVAVHLCKGGLLFKEVIYRTFPYLHLRKMLPGTYAWEWKEFKAADPRSTHKVQVQCLCTLFLLQIITQDISTDFIQRRMRENERRRRQASVDLDPELSQYLEDERLALILQNSEFLQELRDDETFMKTLERGEKLLCHSGVF